jgi:hypothetical protein
MVRVMKDVCPLDFESPVPERVMRWTEGDLHAMRAGVRQLEQALEAARSQLRVAEARVRAQTS